MSEQKTIIVVKPGAISRTDKRKLEKAGYLLVESSVENPMSVFPGIALPVDTFGVFHAALRALSASDYARNAFGKNVQEAILAATQKSASEVQKGKP